MTLHVRGRCARCLASRTKLAHGPGAEPARTVESILQSPCYLVAMLVILWFVVVDGGGGRCKNGQSMIRCGLMSDKDP